jgi:hypothetical protein
MIKVQKNNSPLTDNTGNGNGKKGENQCWDPDPPIFCTDPDLNPDPSIIKQKKGVRKTLIYTLL